MDQYTQKRCAEAQVIYRVDQKKCITFTNKNFKHFVFKNYYSVGRRNLTAWSTHEYSLLSNFDTLQISSF